MPGGGGGGGANLLSAEFVFLFCAIFIVSGVGGQRRRGTPAGCPPPIASFIDYDERVVVRKRVDQKVATVTVEENNFFGETACSIPQELQDPRHTLARAFVVQDGPTRNRIKYCDIFLRSVDFPEARLELTLLLISRLIPSLSYCNGPISAKAKITVIFCNDNDALDCQNKRLDLIETNRNNRIITKENNPRRTKPESDGTSIAQLASVGKETESNLNYTILIGIVFIVTLLAFSLILGLIYFWCPNICCRSCCGPRSRRRANDDLGATKILTVRDNFGKILPEASTVEVWKTRENMVKTYDVPRSETKAGKKGGYRTLNEQSSEDNSPEYSNFNSREESHKTQHEQMEQRSKRRRGDGGGGDRIMLLEQQRPPSQRNVSRLTILEELDPRTLTPLHRSSSNHKPSRYVMIKDGHRGGGGGYSSLKRLKLVKVDRLDQPTEYVSVAGSRQDNSNGQSLNFSRHYSNNNSISTRVVPSDAEYDRRLYYNTANNNKSKRYNGEQGHHHREAREGVRRLRPSEDEFASEVSPRVDRKQINYDEEQRHAQREQQRQQETSRNSFFSEDTGRNINSYQYYDRRDVVEQADGDNRRREAYNNNNNNNSIYNFNDSRQPKQSDMTRALSSISAIIEGDPSDYEEEEEENKVEVPKPVQDKPNLVVSKQEPMSKKILQSLGNFKDNNRTPSPALTLAENALKVARLKRGEKLGDFDAGGDGLAV